MKTIRSSAGIMLPPRQDSSLFPAHLRNQWLGKAKATFAATGKANQTYYALILEALWPEDHGLPGPTRSEEELRAVINHHRALEGKRPYLDVFRRMRELQGDEGFTSIVKSGRLYQLQSMEFGLKREARGRPTQKAWRVLQEEYDFRCAKCSGQSPDVKLVPDHRIPRSRGGTNDATNWQPLCQTCNTFKSAACQGCQRNCMACFWAFPTEYAEITIDDDNRVRLQSAASKNGADQTVLANEILRNYFNLKF